MEKIFPESKIENELKLDTFFLDFERFMISLKTTTTKNKQIPPPTTAKAKATKKDFKKY